jgi:hypothetical protein
MRRTEANAWGEAGVVVRARTLGVRGLCRSEDTSSNVSAERSTEGKDARRGGLDSGPLGGKPDSRIRTACCISRALAQRSALS